VVTTVPPHATDPFPRDRFFALLRRMPRYGRLAWNLSRHPKVTGKRRAVLIAAAVYLVSPIDLVPGFIPVAGQLDDAAAVLLAIGVALRSMQPHERAAALAEVGLDASDIDDDLHTIGASYAWMGRKGVQLGARALRFTARTTARVASGIGARLRKRRGGEPGLDPL
jgi:uncharacterized membrane protein YkvA (DUF1232 family)